MRNTLCQSLAHALVGDLCSVGSYGQTGRSNGSTGTSLAVQWAATRRDADGRTLTDRWTGTTVAAALPGDPSIPPDVRAPGSPM